MLSPWEPLPPPACVRSCRELATEVCNWLTRSWRTLTQDELRSVLMPNYTGGATASPGRHTNTGRRAEVSTDPGSDRGRGGASG